MRRSPGRKGRTCLGIALAAAGTCLGCGPNAATRNDQGREVAAAFLDEIRAGRVDPAWQGTTVEFKSLMGSDSLRDYAKRHPALKAPAGFVASQPVTTGAGKMVDYEFRATPAAPPRSKTPPTARTIRVMVNFAGDPPAVERLVSE